MAQIREKGIYSFVTPYGLLSIHQFRLNSETGLLETVKPHGLPDNFWKNDFRSRRWFHLEETDDCFLIGKTSLPQKPVPWYYHGWCLHVNFFDVNVLLDPVYKFEKEAKERESILQKLTKELENKYNISIIGDNQLINITRK